MPSSVSPISIPLPASAGRTTRQNKISPESQPIQPALAPLLDAFTFAQARNDNGTIITLLVLAYDRQTIEAIDLTALGAPGDVDVFDAFAALDEAKLVAAAGGEAPRTRLAISSLLPSGAMFDRHVATGTNFAAHAKEAGIGRVFNFPKFGQPTPAETTMVVRPGTLMDYEVEISVRFDRDIRSPADFEAARKGFFLCGDFTDRAELIRLVDRDNIASGRGFSDAKSGPDWFPTGPFLVIPRDWREFVKRERIVTRVNDQVRQDSRGSEMILDFEALVAKALSNGGGGNYVYRGQPVPLIEGNFIPRGAAVMSGTGEGVIFMPPMREDVIGGMLDHVLLGRFLRGRKPAESVANRFARNELRAGRYLQVGDRVEHLASTLGALSVTLVAP